MIFDIKFLVFDKCLCFLLYNYRKGESFMDILVFINLFLILGCCVGCFS